MQLLPILGPERVRVLGIGADMGAIVNFEEPHRRWNPLKEQWILCSPQRTLRPWKGAVEKAVEPERPQRDPGCYLCPGATRSNGTRNPMYNDVHVFTNDFPTLYYSSALTQPVDSQEQLQDLPSFIQATQEEGICRVICFSPRHDLTLPEFEVEAIRRVIDTWGNEYQDHMGNKKISYVTIFENKGEIMGCSNPHPHGQIWSSSFIPNIPLKALESQQRYFASHSTSMLQDYLEWELKQDLRIVCQNEAFVCLVPFWAEWPYEVMILPRRTASKILDLSSAERDAWATILKETTTRYDNLFENSFPYSMGVYQAARGYDDKRAISMHQVFLPPLLRSATIKKFMVGYELCAESQRDITAETAANRLRACSTKHYKMGRG